jgi:superoxide dismutase, Cu-Zn family
MQKAFFIVSAAAAAAVALVGLPALAADTASADLVGPDGEQMGRVEMVQGPHGVLVTMEARGLAAGGHGFHIHQTGVCEGPSFESAGEHYAPEGHGHGFLSDDGYHAGDLPNITAGEDGIARADAFATGISLAEDVPNTVFDQDGSAVVIHERMDSYGDEAGAGGRVACGVITPGQ